MKINTINLREMELRGGKSLLDAEIKENGDLVLTGFDYGEFVEEMWGDDDYEYWLTVESEYKDTVLLNLIQKNFDSETKFKEWLTEKGIPFRFENYV